MPLKKLTKLTKLMCADKTKSNMERKANIFPFFFFFLRGDKAALISLTIHFDENISFLSPLLFVVLLFICVSSPTAGPAAGSTTAAGGTGTTAACSSAETSPSSGCRGNNGDASDRQLHGQRDSLWPIMKP